MKHAKTCWTVWLGFIDGKPHVDDCHAGAHPQYNAFPSERRAKMVYEDVRRACIVLDPEPRRAKAKARMRKA